MPVVVVGRQDVEMAALGGLIEVIAVFRTVQALVDLSDVAPLVALAPPDLVLVYVP